MEKAINVGDLVWAKMKGFSPWPGKVAQPGKSLKSKKPKNLKNVYCIWFFGSHNFAWIEDQNIKDYDQYKEQLSKACKNAQFKEACLEIEEYISKRDAGENVDNYPPMEDEEDDGAVEADSSVAEPPELVEEPEKKTPGRKKKSLENGDAIASAKASSPKKRRMSAAERKSIVSPVINARKPQGSKNFLLNRPSLPSRPDQEPVNVGYVSEQLKEKNIVPSELKFGFLGLGVMGSGIVKNLIHSGHQVWVWNRSPDKCNSFVDAGAQQGLTPSDVIAACDITFSCVADPHSAKDMVFGNCGVLQEITMNKGYVEMTGIDTETSTDIAEAIGAKGGRYLEAQIQGSRTEAENGQLIIIAAGERSLYEDCQSAFQSMGRHSFFLGSVGNASRMNLVLQLISGVAISGLAEGMALADRAGLQQKDVMEILNLTKLACPLFTEKGNAIIEGNYPTHQALQHMQKDLNLALGMGHSLEQPLPLAATSNEIFKHARRLGYGDHDVAAVYVRARF